MKRTIFIVGGGIEAVYGIRLAKEMGLHVMVSDRDPEAPGVALADAAFLADTYDPVANLKLAKRYHMTVTTIHGVMSMASDVPFTVATVADALGLPGIPLDVARLSMNKLAMKEKFVADGIPVPWFSSLESADHLCRVVAMKGYPLVVKPVDSRGARGVIRLTPGVDLNWAYMFSRSFSPTGNVMVEEFLSGPQISTESMILNGVAWTPGFADRNYEYLERYAPYIIENGGDLPSYLSEEEQGMVRDLVERAARSLGVKTGVVKGDVVVSEGNPYIIELAARLSGGYYCTHDIPLNTGVPFVEHAIRLALGEQPPPLALQPQYQMNVAQRYLFPKPGRVLRISNVADVAGHPGIAFCEIQVKAGDIIHPIDCHPARAGTVIATGTNREEAIMRASRAVNTISIETAPC
ncbi:MAG: ATP-grasp domain-containing protein [Nitrospirae bacterium]|nr:ATP-grasp domain-containing protein [Nitrospirota bacterium]